LRVAITATALHESSAALVDDDQKEMDDDDDDDGDCSGRSSEVG
jgi:hypothetical protein